MKTGYQNIDIELRRDALDRLQDFYEDTQIDESLYELFLNNISDEKYDNDVLTQIANSSPEELREFQFDQR